MIVLKRISTRLVEETIQPGQTKEFYDIDLDKYDSFDCDIKTINGGLKGVIKVSSLYNNNCIESTKYAFLGERFDIAINIYIADGCHCKISITNNETFLIKCIIRLKIF